MSARQPGAQGGARKRTRPSSLCYLQGSENRDAVVSLLAGSDC